MRLRVLSRMGWGVTIVGLLCGGCGDDSGSSVVRVAAGIQLSVRVSRRNGVASTCVTPARVPQAARCRGFRSRDRLLYPPLGRGRLVARENRARLAYALPDADAARRVLRQARGLGVRPLASRLEGARLEVLLAERDELARAMRAVLDETAARFGGAPAAEPARVEATVEPCPAWPDALDA